MAFLMQGVSEAKQKKVLRFYHLDDAYRSIIGELLIRFILKQREGYGATLEFSSNVYGKPFIKNVPSFHYNLSHSGEWVVCVTGKQPVGIDIEKVGSANIKMAKQVFTDREYQGLQHANSQVEAFYDLWTIKESYVKAVGKGLSIPMNSFEVSMNGSGNVMITDEKVEEKISCRKFHIEDDYKSAVCTIGTEKEDLPNVPEYISFEEIYNSVVNIQAV